MRSPKKKGAAEAAPCTGVAGPQRSGQHELHAVVAVDRVGQHGRLGLQADRVGGRELVKLPFSWNGKAQAAKVQGQSELGSVSLAVKP